MHTPSATQRGVSVIAALVFVAVLGGFAITFDNVSHSATQEAMTAATAAAKTPTLGDIAGPPRPRPEEAGPRIDPELTKKCAAAIEQAKTQETTKTSKPGSNNEDDCVAAIKTSDPKYKDTKGYKCVGKSATVMVKSDGTLEIKAKPNETVEPGKCQTLACQPIANIDNGVAGLPSVKAKCAPVTMSGINKSSVEGALNGPSAFTANRSVTGTLGLGNDTLTPQAPLSPESNKILNAALGRDPNDTTGTIPLDPKTTNLPAPSDQIAAIAGKPDTNTENISAEVTQSVCKTNASLCDVATTKPPPGEQKPPPGEQKPPPGGEQQKPPPGQQQAPPGNQSGPGSNQAGPGNSTFGNPSSGNPSGSGSNPLSSLLSGLANAFKPQPQQPQQPPPQTCPTDPNAYAQYQQQYQQQLQQYNYQLQQYQYQQQLQQYYSTYYGQQQQPPQMMPQMPQQCVPGNPNQCQSQPPQPDPSACSVGTWKPVYGGNSVCISNWQCVPTSGTSTAPTAQISCQPKLADVGMSVAISYSCSSGTASGKGFDVSGQPAGSVTTTVANPPAGTNTATYAVVCTDSGKTSGEQCSVQINKPSIVLAANPKTVASGEKSTIGWVTAGMKSCVISSPDQQDFTDENSSNTSANGTAESSAITKTTIFRLMCETLAGGTKSATTTVKLK